MGVNLLICTTDLPPYTDPLIDVNLLICTIDLPPYTDPLVGAPATFHRRIDEMLALESETKRWERYLKSRKKLGVVT